MHTRKMISLLLVATLVMGPALAWPDQFNDENKNYVPDEVDAELCAPGAPTEGQCDENGAYQVPNHDWIHTAFCDQVPATAPDCEDGYYTGPDLSAVQDQLDAAEQQIQDLIANGTGDDPVALAEQLVPIAYDNLALAINTAHATAADQSAVVGNTYMYMERGGVDRDGDDVPDYFELTVSHGFLSLPANETIYIQSDFIDGDYENGAAFILDPSTGDALGGQLDTEQAPNEIVLRISRNGEPYSTLTFNLTDFQNTLVYRVVDERSRYEPSPTIPITYLQSAEIDYGDPIYFSAPLDQGFIRFWPPWDMDGDNIDNHLEVPVKSHPINGASKPNNLDGDACLRDNEPDPKDRNDQNRAVCLEFAYDLHIDTPDSNPDDPLDNYIWDTVEINFSATPNATLQKWFTENGTQIPKIKYWELWLTSQKGANHHSTNATVSNAYGGWDHDKVYHKDDCDLLPAEPPQGATNPQEGVTHDGDGYQHEHCKFFMDPIRNGDNEASWLYHHQLASGEGSFFGFEETFTLDTAQFVDKQYHIFMYVCLENQDDCALPFATFRDVREQIFSTPHVYINNKPIVRPLTLSDLDGLTERDNVQYSGPTALEFEAFQPLGEPMSKIRFQVQAHGRNDNDEQTNEGLCRWEFDILGMDLGDVRNSSVLQADADQTRCHEANFTVKKVDHLRNDAGEIVRNAHTGVPVGGVYNMTTDTAHWPWGPGTVNIGGDIDLSGNALVGGLPTSFGEVKNWPGSEALDWFSNRAPEVTLADENATLTENRNSGTVSAGLTFDYLDRDAHADPPTATFGLYSNETKEFLEAVQGDCAKVPRPDQYAELVLPANNHNARYECEFITSLAGKFDWQLNVTDGDAGDNRTTINGTDPIEIVNDLPYLTEGSARPNAAESAGSEDTRVMDFQVRYVDPDDFPERVWIEVFDGQGPNAKVLDEHDMATATDCLGDPTTLNQSTTDLCVSVSLEFGDYSVVFHADSIRNGSAVFPDEGRLNFTVGSAIETPPCYACGTDEETMDALSETARMGMLAANEAVLGLPPLTHPGQICQMDLIGNETEDLPVDPTGPLEWLPFDPSECNPNDRDGDGFPNAQEGGGADPDDPWSTPMDHDADLVPNLLEGGPLDVNLFTVRDGFIGLKTEAYITAYGSVDRNAQTPERLNISLLREDEFYNITIRPTTTGGSTTYSGLFVMDYRFTDTGFNVTALDHTGRERFQLMYDRANIGTDEMALRLWIYGNDAQIHELRVWTAPFTVQYNDQTQSVPAGMQPEPDGTYSVWTDLDGDGNREPFPPTGVDTSDQDGDSIPDMVEGLLCSTLPLPNCEGNNLGGLPEHCGILSDYDCDGATDWEEVQQGCNPLDPESHPYNGCDGPNVPPDSDPVGDVSCSGYGPTEADGLVLALVSDADCDGRTNDEELPPDGDPLDPEQ